MQPFFKLHVVPPPKPLDWSSPKSLLKQTLYHHLIQDSAPIGHFYIEIQSDTPNRFGVSHVVTGMSRSHKNLSTIQVMGSQVGLGTFFYDFPGTLDSGEKSLRHLEWAASKGRLKSIRVELSRDRAQVLFDELELWMKHGSYRHYGGGHQILRGEGSGCAEFGSHFLNLAVGSSFTPQEWMRKVFAPRGLVGGERTQKRVSLLKVFLEGQHWAADESSGFLYSTPDMDLAWAWLENQAPGEKEWILTARPALDCRRIQFSGKYPLEPDSRLEELWQKIRVV